VTAAAGQAPAPEARFVAHADWSIHPAKRWIATADLRPDGSSVLTGVERVDMPRLLDRLASAPTAVLGLDVPIGVPEVLARAAGIVGFAEWLPGFVTDRPWRDRLAATPEDISPERPLYPATPGGARHHHLCTAFGVAGIDDLRRRCERVPPLRRAAAPLQWTLGANQVGKAALSCWEELVVPAVQGGARLWPFDGDDLVVDGRATVAEAYPAAMGDLLGLRPGSKRRPADRRTQAAVLHDGARRVRAELAPSVAAAVTTGFGEGADGEHPFDAVVGLLGLLAVLAGLHPAGPPPAAQVPGVRTVEGWIVGVPTWLPAATGTS
jgi:hypothetical protein